MSDTIICKYSCELCGIDEAEVEVPIREKDQDVVNWMQETVITALGAHHFKQSPHCHPETLTKLMVPLPAGSPMIGRPVEH